MTTYEQIKQRALKKYPLVSSTTLISLIREQDRKLTVMRGALEVIAVWSEGGNVIGLKSDVFPRIEQALSETLEKEVL